MDLLPFSLEIQECMRQLTEFGKETWCLFPCLSVYILEDKSGCSMLLHICEGGQHNLGCLEDLWGAGLVL